MHPFHCRGTFGFARFLALCAVLPLWAAASQPPPANHRPVYPNAKALGGPETTPRQQVPATLGSRLAQLTPSPMYVHARSGLSLRAEPRAGAARIAVLPYGDRVEVLSPEPVGEVLTVEEYGPYKVRGRWMNVRSAEGKEGYVFEHYVQPIPVKTDLGEDETYLEWFYGQWIPTATVEMETTEPESWAEHAIDGRTVVYSDGGEYEFAFFEGGISEYLRMPATMISPEAAMVMLRSAFYPHKEVTTEYDEEDQSLRAWDEASALVIKREGEWVVIALHAS